MSGGISGPIAPYSNPPIQSQFYQPSQFLITDVTFGQTTVITTSINNNYVIGQLCRLLFPSKYGCVQLNEKTGIVISLPASNQVELNIVSVGTDPFVALPVFIVYESRTQAQIIAVGDYNSGVTNSSGRSSTGTYILGSFINISPHL